MKYIISFIWALMLTQMVNFVLNSLGGGGPLNIWSGVLLAVLVTLTIIVLDFMLKPDKTNEAQHNH
ncbi:YjzD family protein [Salinicoccus sp. RF5]|uniref:YjzD family protein n=1 Tax=Salinicoccus sp. RF5 TaxID=2748874 RepID=UPI001E551F61|nr:YjzD family protein [Salinicoccus sp. RF5]MCC4722462.1 YjzD family protein [Salinicoccus sp. RF5]